MTVKNVPRFPPSPIASGIRSGKPVKSFDQWLSMAEASNFLNAHEMTLISAQADPEEIATSRAYSYKVRTRQQIRTTVWIIVIRSNSVWYDGDIVPYTCFGTVRIGTGTVYSFGISGDELKQIYILETRAQTTTEYVGTVTITKTGGDSPLYVDQISCYQVRRFALDPEASPSELAADLSSCKPDSLIRDLDNYSVDSVVDGIVNAKTNCRRASLFNWHASDSSGILIGQDLGYYEIFHSRPEVLARYLESGDTVVPVTVSIYAAPGNDGAANGYVRATADSGDIVNFTIPQYSAPTYYTDTLNVKSELQTDSYGRRGATADRIKFEVNGNGNTPASEYFAVRLYSINVGEAAP